MALIPKNDAQIKVAVPTLDDDEAILILRSPTDEEKDRFRRRRTRVKRGNVITDFEVDVKFINRLLIGCENIKFWEGEKIVVLDPKKHTDWKQRIPRDWKISAALAFVTPQAEVEGGEGGDSENFSQNSSANS